MSVIPTRHVRQSRRREAASNWVVTLPAGAWGRFYVSCSSCEESDIRAGGAESDVRACEWLKA